MALVLDGSANTIGGLAVGGLPDGIVDTDMIANNAVTNAKATGIAGGKILQIVNYNTHDAEHEAVVAPGSNADTTWLDVGTYHASDTTYLQATITPTSASNKVMLSCQIFGEASNSDDNWGWRIKRVISGGATTYLDGNDWGNRSTVFGMCNIAYHAGDNDSTPSHFGCSNYVDSPGTTSATTYTIQMKSRDNSASWDLNRTQTNTDHVAYELGISYITLMEVEG